MTRGVTPQKGEEMGTVETEHESIEVTKERFDEIAKDYCKLTREQRRQVHGIVIGMRLAEMAQEAVAPGA